MRTVNFMAELKIGVVGYSAKKFERESTTTSKRSL